MLDKLVSSDPMSTSFTGKQPLQERSKQRMALVIETTESLLESIGFEETSIPEIAKISGVPRASIYQFFANKYILFNHITELHVLNLVKILMTAAQPQHAEPDIQWREYIRLMAVTTADYCNQHPVANLLFFGGLMNRSVYLKYKHVFANISLLFRQHPYFINQGITLPEQPDVVILAIEIAAACMMYGYFHDGYISEEICKEATQAMTRYLSTRMIQTTKQVTE